MPVKKISCLKCSVNKTNYISSDEDNCVAAAHSDGSEDDVIMIDYKSLSLKHCEELGNSWEFYFWFCGSVDEVKNIKFLEKRFLFMFLFFQLTKKEWKMNFIITMLWKVMILKHLIRVLSNSGTHQKFEHEDWYGSLRGKDSTLSFQKYTKVW